MKNQKLLAAVLSVLMLLSSLGGFTFATEDEAVIAVEAETEEIAATNEPAEEQENLQEEELPKEAEEPVIEEEEPENEPETELFSEEPEVELAEVTSLEISITTAGNDQNCTATSTVDALGRNVTKINPMDKTGTVAPAYFASEAEQKNTAFRAIKFVYYVSGSAPVPTISLWAFAGGAMSGRTPVTAEYDIAPVADSWNTVYFDLSKSNFATNDFLHAFMFRPYATTAANTHLSDTIHIGYIGLFDTVANAKAHTSKFEGALNVTGIKVGGTAIPGFNAETTTYSASLGGADVIPDVTFTATGNSNGVAVEKSALNTVDGTASATIKQNGVTIYTVNFTGGSVATSITPKEFYFNSASASGQRCTAAYGNDILGRKVLVITPDDSASPNSSVAPATFTKSDAGHKIIKVVYKATSNKIPKMTVFKCTDTGGMGAQAAFEALYDKAPAAGEWCTVYFNVASHIGDYNIHALMFTIFASDPCTNHMGELTEIGYSGYFGSIVDAKAHTSPFEGELSITGIKVGDTPVANFDPDVHTYSADLAGAYSLSAVTLSGTGDATGLTAEKTELDFSTGTATAIFKQNGATIYTVNFTGGSATTDTTPIQVHATWAGPKDQRCTRTATSDDFGRSIDRYNPVWQYVSGGSDLFATGSVSPGGAAGVAEAKTSTYKVMKLVFKSTSTVIPTLLCFKTNADNSGYNGSVPVSATSEAVASPNVWNTVYYDYSTAPNGMWQYMINFAPSNTTEVGGQTQMIDDVFEIGYMGVFASMADAYTFESPFEGEFEITDVKLGGTSIGNVAAYNKDLDGAGIVPALTVSATGNTNNVVITNGTLDEDGNATSTVVNGATTAVTVNFTGGSTVFAVTGISYDGTPVEDFVSATTEYTVALPFASAQPVVTFTNNGVVPATVAVSYETVAGGFKAYIKNGDTTLYTVNFNVSTDKPTELLNTLYKLNSDKAITVGYFGGSVTAGTGATNANNTSWRGLTRDWLKARFPEATVTERNASIGGTGSIFGIYRAETQYILDKAPDLNFIEMCINDSYDGVYNTNANYIYVESIVRKIYASNPKANIIFIVTGDQGTMRTEYSSATPVYGVPYTAIGGHYNIPVIYVGYELAKDIYAENGSFPSATTDAAWGKYFKRADNAVDGVHPNDTGYAHYAATIEEYLDAKLPTGYTPETSEYADKTLPTTHYCTENSKGDLLDDAYMVSPADIVNKATALGGYSVTTSGNYNPLVSSVKDDVVSLKFKASAIGIWTWSYGTTNGINGTNISYSIDGGTPVAANLYRSYPNHKIYTLATGLSDGEHTIRIIHSDSDAKVDIRNFLLWDLPVGITNEEKGITAVPYIDTTATGGDGEPVVNVTLASAPTGIDSVFNFDPTVMHYDIPISITGNVAEIVLAEAITYPTLNISVPSGYYGYTLTQAGEGGTGTNTATLEIDNVGLYEFEFVLEGVPDGYTATSPVTPFGSDGKITFDEATTKILEIKESKDEDYTQYPIGTLEITGLSAGLYTMRYVDGENTSSEVTARIWETYPADANVYYVSDGATGNGLTPETPARTDKIMQTVFADFKTAFAGTYATKTNYIVMIGDVTQSNAAALSTAGFAETIVTSEAGAKFRAWTHIANANVSNPCKLTWKNIDVILGNPTRPDASMNGEIYYSAYGQEITFDEFNIVGYATNAAGTTRTTGLYIHYFGDGGGTYTCLNSKPVTINCSNLNIAQTRSAGWNASEVTKNVDIVLKNAQVASFGVGGHGSSAINTGVNRGTIDGGNITKAYVGPASDGKIEGSAIIVVNGGTIGSIAAKAATQVTKDTVLIVNNDLSYTVNQANLDYYLKSGLYGSADATFDSANSVESFVFTTEKNFVFIDKGTANEKKLTVAEGTATLTASELGTGEHAVLYADSDFIVSFNKGANAYATVPADEEHNANDVITSIAAPTANNGARYEFLGWSADGTNLATFPYTVTGDVTFTALWTENANVWYVSDKTGTPDGGYDPSKPLGGSSATSKVFAPATFACLKGTYNSNYNTMLNATGTTVLEESIEGFTLATRTTSNSSIKNAMSKVTAGADCELYVVDYAFYEHGTNTGKTEIYGMDGDSKLLMLGGTGTTAGEYFLDNIAIINLFTDEAIIKTFGRNYTLGTGVTAVGGTIDIDGVPHVVTNYRNYATSATVYFNKATGATSNCLIPSAQSKFRATGSAPRIFSSNYDAETNAKTSTVIVNGGPFGIVGPGANYNSAANSTINGSTIGDRTVILYGETSVYKITHNGRFDGIATMKVEDGASVTDYMALGGDTASTGTTNYGRGSVFGYVHGIINGGTVKQVFMQSQLASAMTATADADGYYTKGTINGTLGAKGQLGVVVLEVNGGTITSGIKSRGTNADATQVIIFNNGTNATVAAGATDIVISSPVGGKITANVDTSATLSEADLRPFGEAFTFEGFTATTDKDRVVLKATTSGDVIKTYDTVEGSAVIPKADLTAADGKYTIEYVDIPTSVTVSGKVYLERESDNAPTAGNYARLSVYDADNDTFIKSINLENAETRTIAEGTNLYFNYSAEITVTDIGTSTNVYVIAEKNGYAPVVSNDMIYADVLGTTVTLDINLAEGGGDIKGAFTDFCGDGIVDIDDFIRVIRGFSTEIQASANADEYRKAVDINEDTLVTIEDLAIVKANITA